MVIPDHAHLLFSASLLNSFDKLQLTLCLAYHFSDQSTFNEPNVLTLKAPIRTAADNTFCNIFLNFRKK